ncbi:hypothetical protein QW131_15420 [Roseibium salinum]|nr:hypothetical protein [Roseibium salinum]
MDDQGYGPRMTLAYDDDTGRQHVVTDSYQADIRGPRLKQTEAYNRALENEAAQYGFEDPVAAAREKLAGGGDAGAQGEPEAVGAGACRVCPRDARQADRERRLNLRHALFRTQLLWNRLDARIADPVGPGLGMVSSPLGTAPCPLQLADFRRETARVMDQAL